MTEHTAHATPGQGDRKALKKAFAASLSGTSLEWYDFALFGAVTGTVFSKLFFDGSDPAMDTVKAFMVYGAGYIARPIGGIFFGRLGDIVGRKQVLVWTLLLIGFATAAIAILPTYAQAGIWAPILLVLMRFSCRESASVVSGAGRCCSRAISPPRTPAACGPRPRRPGCRSERSSPTCSCSG